MSLFNEKVLILQVECVFRFSTRTHRVALRIQGPVLACCVLLNFTIDKVFFFFFQITGWHAVFSVRDHGLG